MLVVLSFMQISLFERQTDMERFLHPLAGTHSSAGSGQAEARNRYVNLSLTQVAPEPSPLAAPAVCISKNLRTRGGAWMPEQALQRET